MKKRLLAVFLCLAMTVSMLAGCGTDNSSEEKPAEEQEEDGFGMSLSM